VLLSTKDHQNQLDTAEENNIVIANRSAAQD